MSKNWAGLGACLGACLLLTPTTLPGQDNKPAPEDKQPALSKEVVFKGTLTGLEQENTHSLTLKKNVAYAITLESRGFFIHVQIENGQRKKLLTSSSSSTFKAPDDGPFRLVVSSPGGSSGHYVVSVRPANLTAAKSGEVLTVGKDGLTVDAVLAKEDPLDKVRKKYCRIFDVKMSAGKTYVIDLMSQQFDAYLRLEDAAGKQLAQDDDSGGGNNARLRFKAPGDGVYRIIATSFGLETGLFTLKVREDKPEKSQ